MNEVILLNKPAGCTSFDAVRKCRGILHEKKGGHTGTLDPNASGLMIVLLGRYTKLVPFCKADHKTYEAEFLLGRKTETEDIWGETVEEKPWHSHEQAELDAVSASMLGTQKQIPPMYSAIRYQGKKLYEYARKGITVEREPREITVDDLRVHHLHDNVYTMHASVSAGTYIRTLITDYAAKLGEYACMSALVRTGIDSLKLEEAVTFEELAEGKGFVEPARVIDPSWHFAEALHPEDIHNGKTIRFDSKEPKIIFTDQGKLLAAYELRRDGYYHCVRGLE